MSDDIYEGFEKDEKGWFKRDSTADGLNRKRRYNEVACIDCGVIRLLRKYREQYKRCPECAWKAGYNSKGSENKTDKVCTYYDDYIYC